ncbi:MAG: hypothetical protein ABGZ35_13515, partial [Planctomycetaceae bacterium]
DLARSSTAVMFVALVVVSHDVNKSRHFLRIQFAIAFLRTRMLAQLTPRDGLVAIWTYRERSDSR